MGVFFTAVHWNTSQLCFFEFFVGVFFTLEDITIVFFLVFCCCFLHYITISMLTRIQAADKKAKIVFYIIYHTKTLV